MNTLLPPSPATNIPAHTMGNDRGRPFLAGGLLVVVLPLLGWITTRDLLPAWGIMWVLCFTLFVGCKGLTLHSARRRGPGAPLARVAAYLLAWPGMDAAAFLHGPGHPVLPAGREWLFATSKLALGLLLVWGLAGRLAPDHPVLAGWTGMVGLIFILHFGTFHLLSLGWRRMGVRAEPLMRAPLLATSLAEFWGRRWNAAFHELVHRYCFRPLLRATGARSATLLVFLLSGLIHELVISVPARGGYGGPTAYFLLHGAGLVLEHSRTGRRWGLGTGWRGWSFTHSLAAVPVGLLFHPPFVRNVILPFLHAIGAT